MVSWCHGVTGPATVDVDILDSDGAGGCHGVMVSWCHGVMVSLSQGIMVSGCYGVRVLWCQDVMV
jgi:hypothetical protein